MARKLKIMENDPRTAARDPLSKLQKITAKSLSLTYQQFSIILKAGLPLV